MKYMALSTLWHTRQERYIPPGETVDLSHLNDDEIQYLVELGVIAPVNEEEDYVNANSNFNGEL